MGVGCVVGAGSRVTVGGCGGCTDAAVPGS